MIFCGLRTVTVTTQVLVPVTPIDRLKRSLHCRPWLMLAVQFPQPPGGGVPHRRVAADLHALALGVADDLVGWAVGERALGGFDGVPIHLVLGGGPR
jgi:hypothetical protein